MQLVSQFPSRYRGITAALAVALSVVAGSCSNPDPAAKLARIETIVVIYAENRGFDHLYGSPSIRFFRRFLLTV